MLSYGFSFLSFVLLPLIPNQKADAQLRKRSWPERPLFGVIALGMLAAAFLYSVSLTLLTMFPGTQCLKLVGGAGCGGHARVVTNATST